MDRRILVVLAALAAILWPLTALADTPNVTDPRNLDTFTLLGVAFGYLVPWITAVVTKTHWPQDAKHAVFGVLAIGAAAIDAAAKASLDWHDWARALLIVGVSGLASYRLNKGAILKLSQRTD